MRALAIRPDDLILSRYPLTELCFAIGKLTGERLFAPSASVR